MIITTQQILALRPCAEWPRKRIAAVVGDGITPKRIAADERISLADRCWVLTRLCAALPDGRQRLVLWAAGCAQDVAHLASDEDVARCAISTAVAWAEGCATVEEVRDAAAYAAVAASFSYAATAADAAYAAAYTAYAADTAYADAYADAAYEVAVAAERDAVARRHLLDLAAAMEEES